MNFTPQSLKLLEMPLLRKKLGFNKDLSDERVTGSTDFGYNRKVLLGNWFEDGFEQTVGTEMDLCSTYGKDYISKIADQDTRSIWDNRLQAQGAIRLKQGMGDDEYMANMATVYDLAYRCKVRDFSSGDYGNVTNYGKKECKQRYWLTQRDDRRVRYHTEYRDAYGSHPCDTHIIS